MAVSMMAPVEEIVCIFVLASPLGGRTMGRSKSRKLVGVGNSHCIACPLTLGCQHLDTCTCLMLFCPCILLRQKRNGLVKGELVWCCLLPTLCMWQVRLLHLLPSSS